MTISEFWYMALDWDFDLEVYVYKNDALIYKGRYLGMSDEVLNAKVYRFSITSECLVIYYNGE